MTIQLKTVVYLANPYSSRLKNPDDAALERHKRRAFESYVGGTLRKRYRDVCFILPIALSGSMADLCTFDTGFKEWEGDDLTFISRSDEVWVLTSKGWKESIGVQAEIAFAESIGIPVRYLDPKTLDFIKVKVCQK